MCVTKSRPEIGTPATLMSCTRDIIDSTGGIHAIVGVAPQGFPSGSMMSGTNRIPSGRRAAGVNPD